MPETSRGDTVHSVDSDAPPKSYKTGHRSRHVARMNGVPFFGHSVLMSRFQQAVGQVPVGTKMPGLAAFARSMVWIGKWFQDCLRRKEPYRTYPEGQTGIYEIAAPKGDSELRISVAGDWGTGTREAEIVAQNMLACKPHYTLHLGDVYYMGEVQEIEESCLGKKSANYVGVKWPLGSEGSFALMGNHEIYSGGKGYYDTFLLSLGLLNEDGSVRERQLTSHYCLETEHWVILGLDTGYHSGGLGWLASIPVVRGIPFFNVDSRFDDKMMDWLKRTAAALEAKGSGKKPVVLLTHHQPVSSFEQAFRRPVRQLDELGFLKSREFVWLYGHEHRLTVYKPQDLTQSLRAYPRCIGHGGMPVDVSNARKVDDKVMYYDPRRHAIDDQDPKTMVGYNGHVVLLFEGENLTVEYRDIKNNRLLLSETFVPKADGRLKRLGSAPTHGLVLGHVGKY